ncbi:MAG: DEAD/DEAH box helicase family protein [Deltaproteobacteria bacterium]
MTPFVEKETALLGSPALSSVPATSTEKIDLFLRLFCCRDDVSPKLWENKSKETKGYSPVCANEWVRGVCGKPKVKCSDCQGRSFQKLDTVALEAHLRGAATIGTYAIRTDDSCVFLACDFDGDGWQDDVKTYRNAARSMGIDVAVERSQSGVGAHAWIFFQSPVPARLARLLGTVILSKCSEYRPDMGLESFDRFFPNQDYLPKGGFGDLIALPLQKLPREQGNTCFLDKDLNAIQDQWGCLAEARRLSLDELRSLVSAYLPSKPQAKAEDGFDDVSWITDQNVLESSVDSKKDVIAGVLSGPFELRLDSQLHIPLEGLPGKIIHRLRRTASFANPEFYRRQRMRMQTYPESRFIFSGEMRPDEIILPRGILDSVTKILAEAGAQVVIRDERLSRKRIKATFKGELTQEQARSVKIIKSHDCGVLVAPPGVGKTVMGCALITERKVATLILVHRQPLLDQWIERLTEFLDMNKKDIGVFGGTRKKRTGRIDIGMLQSITKSEVMEEIAGSYSQIIIDECHHIPAASFESVMKQIPAKYVLGLTATPRRKDGLEKILYQQCGPIRHEMQPADEGRLSKTAYIRETGFRVPLELGDYPPYHLLIESLVTNEKRNALIASDVVSALRSLRFPLLISDRKEHMEQLERLIKEQASNEKDLSNLRIIRMDGNLSAKKRRAVLGEIGISREAKEPTLIIATASLIGEGFDMADLDTLVLSMPLSFEGRMIQYAGRLHRLSEGKSNVLIYDYLDSFNAMLLKMYRNRLKAYRKMGYIIQQMQGELGYNV